MYCLDYAERSHLLYCTNWCHSQFTFASYTLGCNIWQPDVAATVRMDSDVVLSFTGALLMKTVTKIFVDNKWSTFASAGFGCWIISL